MKAEYVPLPPVVVTTFPLVITFETEQEQKDLRWLIGYDSTIPNAIANQSTDAKGNHKRAQEFLQRIQRTINATKRL